MKAHIETSPKETTAELRSKEWVRLNQIKKGVKGACKNVYTGREHSKREGLNKGQCDWKDGIQRNQKIQVLDETGNTGGDQPCQALKVKLKNFTSVQEHWDVITGF